MLKFKVTRKFGERGPEEVIAQFKYQKNAVSFIESELDEAANLNQNVTCYLDDHITKKAFDSRTRAAAHKEHTGPVDECCGSGPGSHQSFRPSPLPTAPRMPGTPSKWWKEEEDKDDKGKK